MAEKINTHIWSTTPAIAENIKQLQDKINELIDEINELKMREGKPTNDERGLHKHGVNVRFNSELRDKFFKECTDPSPDSGRNAGIRPINLTAHDLFEWFKRNAR